MNRIFNIRTVLVASLIGLMAPAIAAPNHDLTPKYGGVVVETKVGDMEIVAKPTSIQIYIADHGKAVNLEGAKAKVTLLDRKSTRLNSSHITPSRMPSSA